MLACTFPSQKLENNGSDHGSQSWKLPVSATEFNYLEKDDMIRFKIEEETFKEATPAPPKVQENGVIENRNEEHKDPIYSLIVTSLLELLMKKGSCQEDGLGLAAWWED